MHKNRNRKYVKSVRGRIIAKKYRKKNLEKCKAILYQYQSSAKGKTTIRRWRQDNPERQREYKRQQRLKNPGRFTSDVSKRRASKLNATPSWVDLSTILKIYKRAAKAGKQVDHIVPLQHPLVCGLHVPWNLQLLTPQENQSKNNTF